MRKRSKPARAAQRRAIFARRIRKAKARKAKGEARAVSKARREELAKLPAFGRAAVDLGRQGVRCGYCGARMLPSGRLWVCRYHAGAVKAAKPAARAL